MEYIQQMEPSFDSNEIRAFNEYMLSGGLGKEAEKTREFEELIKAYTGAKHCRVVANGTVSLSAALVAVDVGVGDEVICPDYTMAATPNSVEMIGAKAVFCDIDRSTLCMDFEKMKQAVTPRTKAIMLVSINGRHPKEMQRFTDFCKERDIHLIEDAAQSLGSFCGDKHLGCIGEIGSYSFSAPKIITTGQGGALVTNSDELAERINQICDFGRIKAGEDRYYTMGWNFKFTDFLAVIGIQQMKKLPYRVERKREMGRLYAELLTGVSGVELVETDFNETTPWLFDILCERRTDLKKYLHEKNIGTRVFYPALHKEAVYGYTDQSYPVAEDVADRGLWLPSSMALTDEMIKYVCRQIRNFYN